MLDRIGRIPTVIIDKDGKITFTARFKDLNTHDRFISQATNRTTGIKLSSVYEKSGFNNATCLVDKRGYYFSASAIVELDPKEAFRDLDSLFQSADLESLIQSLTLARARR